MTQANPFAPAIMTDSYLRMALSGPEGSGKTYTSILLATLMLGGEVTRSGSTLARRENGLARIAFIDSERGSARKYSPIFTSNVEHQGSFDVLELKRSSQGAIDPNDYTNAITAARENGYEILIIDSLSHAWEGVLEKKDKLDKANYNVKGANNYTNWRDITPIHNRLVDSILSYPGHVFVAMRVKTERVIERENGRTVVKTLGLKSVQREGLNYEFDIILDMAHSNATVSKSRCKPLDELQVVDKPGREVADILLNWLNTGIDMPMQKAEFIETLMETGRFNENNKIGRFLQDNNLLHITGQYKYEEMLESALAILEANDDPDGAHALTDDDAQALADEIINQEIDDEAF